MSLTPPSSRSPTPPPRTDQEETVLFISVQANLNKKEDFEELLKPYGTVEDACLVPFLFSSRYSLYPQNTLAIRKTCAFIRFSGNAEEAIDELNNKQTSAVDKPLTIARATKPWSTIEFLLYLCM